jgi:hypothetical protein
VLHADYNFTIDLSGGLFEPGATFCVGGNSDLNVFGEGLELVIEDTIARLTGTLLDGNELSVQVVGLGTGSGGGSVHLFNVPEPGTGLLVIAPLIGLAVRRRRVES